MTAAAQAYDRHVGRYGRQLAAGLIDAAGVERGQRALDVGCGPGALTTALADVIGAENVAAVDPSERFVEACRERVTLPAHSTRVVGTRNRRLIIQVVSSTPRTMQRSAHRPRRRVKGAAFEPATFVL
jgi:trans-aconitate methyltransferase